MIGNLRARHLRPTALALLLLAGAVLAGAPAPEAAPPTAPPTDAPIIVPLRLGYADGERVAFIERLTGSGTLIRHDAGGDTELPLDFEAEGRRLWTIDVPAADRLEIEARSTAARMVVRVAGQAFEAEAPWRSFTLAADRQGRIMDAVPLTNDAPAANDLPLDLDLSELLALFELAMLPPEPMPVGASWSLTGPTTALPNVRGQLRLLSLEPVDGRSMAQLETTLATTFDERPSPAPGVVLGGSVEATVRSRFDVEAGRVISAEGPLQLLLQYRRRGGTALATLRLLLNVSLEQTAPPALARGSQRPSPRRPKGRNDQRR